MPASSATTASASTQPVLPSPPAPVPLAPGFRFHPTDEELVAYYLFRKVNARPLRVDAIPEVDLYRLEPWDLPPLSRVRSRDSQWYFFTHLGRKFSSRCRTNRATPSGYWKTTGKDRTVFSRSSPVGTKKTLVYHLDRAPHGLRTNWVMHEYRLLDSNPDPQDLYVVCRIFLKNGSGPQNGAQYGAPYSEEDWEEIDEKDQKPLIFIGASSKTEEENEFSQNQSLHNHIDSEAAALLAVPDNRPVYSDSIISSGDVADTQNDMGDNARVVDCMPNEQTDFNNLATAVSGSDSKIWPLKACKDLQQISHGTGNLQEILEVQEFFDFTSGNASPPEESQFHPFDNDSSYAQTGDLSSHDQENDGMFFDASDDLPLGTGAPNEFVFLTPPSPVFDPADDLLAYFEATENDIKHGISGDRIEETDDYSCAQNMAPNSLFNGLSSSDTNRFSGDSSDVREKNDMDDEKTIGKHLMTMLGSSMPAAPCMAAELSGKSGKSFGSISTTEASSSVRVTAGVIHIHNSTYTVSSDVWFFQKSGLPAILDSYGTTLDAYMRPRDNEPMQPKPQGSWMALAMSQGSYYMVFVSALILTLSYKAALCVCDGYKC